MNHQHTQQVVDIAGSSFDTSWSYDQFLFFLNHPCGHSLGVTVDSSSESRLVSYLIALRVEDELDIVSLATRQKFRGLGLATSLIHSLEEDQVKIFLEVDARNDPALMLYRRAGFEITGIRRRYYEGKWDAICMSNSKRASYDPASKTRVR